MAKARLSRKLACKVMQIVCGGDGIIPTALLPSAEVLASRGYLTVTILDDGRRHAELTALARGRTSNYLGWHRYPPIYAADKTVYPRARAAMRKVRD